MRKIREVLRLKFEVGLSARQISTSLHVGRATVGDYLNRFAASGLTWPSALTDAELQRRLFSPAPTVPSNQRPMPDWPWAHAELRRPGVTLALLWQEYRLSHPQGFKYSWFCEHYRLWTAKVDVVMRQEHRAGEKLFVDYAGQTVPVIDRLTGEIRQTQIFVAVLGASSYTFAEATWSQKLPDWLGSHARCFAFFCGAPQILVPDNLRSGVTKAHRYEPDINPSYRHLAEHYGVAVLPARSRKPRDNAKVEVGVQVVERWILAALRNRQFFSLGELNAAIGVLLDRLNQRPFKKLPGSRRSAFETIDQPALQPLPEHPYVYAEWKKMRVHIDYHVEVDGHYYSVPYQLVKHQLEVRLAGCWWPGWPDGVECACCGWLYLAAVLDLFSRKNMGLGDGSEHVGGVGVQRAALAIAQRQVQHECTSLRGVSRLHRQTSVFDEVGLTINFSHQQLPNQTGIWFFVAC